MSAFEIYPVNISLPNEYSHIYPFRANTLLKYPRLGTPLVPIRRTIEFVDVSLIAMNLECLLHSVSRFLSLILFSKKTGKFIRRSLAMLFPLIVHRVIKSFGKYQQYMITVR